MSLFRFKQVGSDGKILSHEVDTSLLASGRLGATLRCHSGAAAAEFAIILPIFALTMMALMEFGHLFWHQVSMRYAVEQTTRNAMAEYTRESFVNANFNSWYANWTPSLEASVPNEVFGWDPSAATFSASTSSTLGVNYLTVDAAYTYQFIFDFIPGITSIALSATSTTPLVGAW